MLKGTTTRSPFLMLLTASPVSSITPMISWPTTVPSLSGVRPSYICRSLPEVVSRNTASVGDFNPGLGCSTTFIWRLPSKLTAFIKKLQRFDLRSRGTPFIARSVLRISMWIAPSRLISSLHGEEHRPDGHIRHGYAPVAPDGQPHLPSRLQRQPLAT